MLNFRSFMNYEKQTFLTDYISSYPDDNFVKFYERECILGLTFGARILLSLYEII